MNASADCAIVGGGPAGLTAAIYLARFRLDVRVIDAGRSRCASIPLTRNHAGFPDGIAGGELLARMRRQAMIYGAGVASGTVERLAIAGDEFTIDVGADTIRARTILLATGVVNNRPDMPAALHDEAVARGLLRYCPICDGYEVSDAHVGVIGTGERGAREALFLRGYTADLTLIAPDGPHDLDQRDRRSLGDAGIAIADGPAEDFAIEPDAIAVTTANGISRFASIYPAMGSVIRSELAVALGADATGEGCLVVDDHQRTTIPGLFAAGDVVLGLDQISHAMGEGGVAATTIRADLAERRPIRR